MNTDADTYDLHFTRAEDAFGLRGDYETALREITFALAIKPGDGEALSLHSMILAGLDRLDSAEGVARQAVAVDPENADYLSILASILFDKDEYTAAKELYQKARLKLTKRTEFCHGFLLGGLADCLEQLGDLDGARNAMLHRHGRS
jgi:Flp pilus assembly protein TadD